MGQEEICVSRRSFSVTLSFLGVEKLEKLCFFYFFVLKSVLDFFLMYRKSRLKNLEL